MTWTFCPAPPLQKGAQKGHHPSISSLTQSILVRVEFKGPPFRVSLELLNVLLPTKTVGRAKGVQF